MWWSPSEKRRRSDDNGIGPTTPYLRSGLRQKGNETHSAYTSIVYQTRVKYGQYQT